MRTFLFGAAVGAMSMYFYLEGFGPIVWMVQSWWLQASAPHASALHQ
jgi:hypothetical protein